MHFFFLTIFRLKISTRVTLYYNIFNVNVYDVVDDNNSYLKDKKESAFCPIIVVIVCVKHGGFYKDHGLFYKRPNNKKTFNLMGNLYIRP